MASEPAIKRAVAFVDGQNLFYAAKIAFGYSFPNYDVRALWLPRFVAHRDGSSMKCVFTRAFQMHRTMRFGIIFGPRSAAKADGDERLTVIPTSARYCKVQLPAIRERVAQAKD